MTSPKKHHFLPQSYLEGFQTKKCIGKEPKIYVFEKESSGRVFPSSICDTGCQTDFHTIKITDSIKDRESVESELSKFEGIQKTIINRIISSESLESVSIYDLAAIVSFMRHRVPSVKQFIEENIKGVVKTTGQILLDKGHFSPMPVEVEEYIKKGGNLFSHIKVSNEFVLAHMFNMGLNENGLSLLASMNFALLKAPAGIEFITGDAPVSVFLHNYDARQPYGAGLTDRNIELTFPLNCNYLLLASRKEMPKYQEVTGKDVEEYNRRTIVMAQNYVYKSDADADTLQAVRKLAGSKAGYLCDLMQFQGGAIHISRFIPVTDPMME